jgi:hypothetical protein
LRLLSGWQPQAPGGRLRLNGGVPTQPGERHEGDCTGQKGGGLDGMADLIHYRDKISTIFENPQEKSADSALNRIQVAQNQWFKKFIEKIKKQLGLHRS